MTDHTRFRTSLIWLLAGLAVMLAANSVLGPLVTETIEYRYSETLINQGIGLDAVALFGAAPIAIAAAVLVQRRHRAGPALSFIPATFAAYMAPQYADRARLPQPARQQRTLLRVPPCPVPPRGCHRHHRVERNRPVHSGSPR